MFFDHSMEEACLLGGLLVDGKRFPEVEDIVSELDFQSEIYQGVFRTMVAVYRATGEIDPVSVKDKTPKLPDGQDRGKFFVELMDINGRTSAKNIVLAKAVKKNSLRRQLAQIGEDMTKDAIMEDPSDLIEKSMGRLHLLQENTTEDKPGNGLVELSKTMDAIEEGEIAPLQTGLPLLDNLLKGGFRPSTLNILAARPGVGKTSVALTIADHVAARGCGVVFCTMEMTTVELTAKRVARLTGIDSARLTSEKLSDTEYDKVAEAYRILEKLNLTIIDEPHCTIGKIEAKCRCVANLKLVVIDYIGLLESTSFFKSLYEKMTSVSREVKLLSKALGVPVLCLAQINRETDKDKGRRPRPSDLRDSGALEQDADTVIMLSPANSCNDIGVLNMNEGVEGLVLDLAKNRHGPVGRMLCGFRKATSDVFDMGIIERDNSILWSEI